MRSDVGFLSFVWALCWPMRAIYALVFWIGGRDLDNGLFGAVDAFGPLLFLTAFATTQCAAFFVAVQGKDAEKILIPSILFWFFSTLTLWGIVLFLRETVRENEIDRHAYTNGTIRFGRWALWVALVFAIGFPALGFFNMIPGQEKRVSFEANLVPSMQPRSAASFRELGDHRIDRVNEWARLIIKGLYNANDKSRDTLVIEQDGSFSDDVHTFVAWTAFGANAKTVGGKAFLVRGAVRPNDVPTYDELKMTPDESDPVAKETIEIKQPNKGDFVVLFLTVEARKTPSTAEPFPPPDVADYHFQLRVRR
jgi:hypothetical protein